MKTGKEAAKAFKRKTTNRVGMCLWECQEIYPTNHQYPSAINQWQNAKKKHPDSKKAPVGAPMYYRGGRYGHIVLYVGDGMVRSTDAGGSGRMATVPIEWFKNAWGYEYLGWSEDLGGQDLHFDDTIDVFVKKLKPGVDDSDSVKQLRFRLIKRGFLEVSKPLSKDRPGNKYTDAVTRAVRKWQKKKGHEPTGVLTNRQAREFFAPNKKVTVHPE